MTSQQLNQAYHQTLRSGITIYPSQDKAIRQTLGELVQKTPAHFVLLVDVTGQVVSVQGEYNSNTDLVALGSLVAGDLSASQEIARLTNQYQDCQMVLRQGQTIHTFIVEAGHHLALLIQISDQVPLGWARMLIQKTAHRLGDIVVTPPTDVERAQATEQKDQILNQEELPDLFKDALDGLWME